MNNNEKAIELSKQADIIVVGTGFTGATYAYMFRSRDFRVLLIDKRDHIAGNAFTERKHGIDVHKYGAHIFHTPNEDTWKFVKQFGKFNNYRHKVIAKSDEKTYSLPFTLKTMSEIYGYHFEPASAREYLKSKIGVASYEYGFDLNSPKNLEEKAISLVGPDIYERLIRDYTMKQWNVSPRELDQSIITRLPVRYNYNTDYFNDTYQGIPVDGYTKLVKDMLQGCMVVTNVDYFDIRDQLPAKPYTIYTGPIDKFFDYQFGKLKWRSVEFQEVHMPSIDDALGTSVVNYCDLETPYTRAIEHKHFNPLPEAVGTIVSFEKSCEPDEKRGIDPYYPIDLADQREVLKKYNEMKDIVDHRIHIGGRLGDFKYYDMHQAIGIARKQFPSIFQKATIHHTNTKKNR